MSVIIPTFNRAAVLDRAMESVAAQSYPDWELLIADDGSTDRTADVVAAFRDRHDLADRCRWLRYDKNTGVSAARNRAAREARGDFLAFLDSDDQWLPRKLDQQLPLSERNALVHGDEIWMRNGRRVNPGLRHRKSGGWIFHRCVELCCISPSAALIRRKTFENAGGFREDFPVCEDYDLWLRLSARMEVGFVAEPVLVKYGGHADQLSRRFPAMDRYRVRALAPFANDLRLSSADRAAAAAEMARRAQILLKGYEKRGNRAAYDELSDLVRNALTQVHRAHSAAERRPRSD